MSGTARSVAEIFRRHGQRVTIVRAEGEREETVGFLQPIFEGKNTEQRQPTALGRRREDRYLYLGLPQVPIQAGGGDVLCYEGERYTVQSAHPIWIGREISHWWGVLVPEDEMQ